jgi:hypothetical protein
VATTASPTALAYAQAPVSGSHLFMITAQTAASPAISGITDTLLNTWAARYTVTVGAFEFEVWSAPCPTGGANTATVTWAAGVPSGRFWIGEIANGGGSVAFTNGNSLDDTTSGNPVTVATLTTAGAAIVLSILRTDGATTFTEWADNSAQVGWAYLLGNGTTNFAAWTLVGEATSVAPILRTPATTGESVTVAFSVTMPSSGGGASQLINSGALVG